MILLLGASGYVGRAFAGELRRRGQGFIPLTRRAFDYARFDFLFDYLRTIRPVFLINAANYESPLAGALPLAEKDKMMAANAMLPQVIARACLMTRTPWGHVSTGSVFCGAKVLAHGQPVLRWRLDDAETLELFNSFPARFHGFTESDEPNFTFRNPACHYYNGTKALAEEAIKDFGQSYVWRLRLPFNEREETCNWLWQMQRRREAIENIHSISHIEDCVKACLDLWQAQAPFGFYHVANPGAITFGHAARRMERVLGTAVRVRTAADETAPPGCILDCGKLARAGVKLRPAQEAFEDCLGRLRIAERTTRASQVSARAYSAAAW